MLQEFAIPILLLMAAQSAHTSSATSIDIDTENVTEWPVFNAHVPA